MSELCLRLMLTCALERGDQLEPFALVSRHYYNVCFAEFTRRLRFMQPHLTYTRDVLLVLWHHCIGRYLALPHARRAKSSTASCESQTCAQPRLQSGS